MEAHMNAHMSPRVAILVVTCSVAALTVLGVAVCPTAPERAAVPSHGAFAARFQPALDGIGSTRDLTPVPLGEAEQAASTSSGRHPTRGRSP
jgi:hypothetical protein